MHTEHIPKAKEQFREMCAWVVGGGRVWEGGKRWERRKKGFGSKNFAEHATLLLYTGILQLHKELSMPNLNFSLALQS
jgi:hypothetical protein